jgi:Na+/H+ antiporter subunit
MVIWRMTRTASDSHELGRRYRELGAHPAWLVLHGCRLLRAGAHARCLGVGLLLLGMCLQSGFSLVTMKLLFLLALFFFTGPVVAHALSQACLHENIKPILTEDRRGAGRPQPEGPAGSAGEGRRP